MKDQIIFQNNERKLFNKHLLVNLLPPPENQDNVLVCGSKIIQDVLLSVEQNFKINPFKEEVYKT